MPGVTRSIFLLIPVALGMAFALIGAVADLLGFSYEFSMEGFLRACFYVAFVPAALGMAYVLVAMAANRFRK